MSESSSSSPLRRDLSVWGALGLSVAVLGPSMAVNINPQAPAAHVGRAVPLVFAISTVAVVLVAYAFVRLCQNFAHAGSVYGFAAATVGPRTGFVAGWLLLGTYVAFAVCTVAGGVLFFSTFLEQVGVGGGSGWLVPAVIILAGVAFLASRPAKSATAVLLVIEVVTMVVILVIAVVIFIRLAAGNPPQAQQLTASIFTLPEGASSSGLFFAMTFGFLSFAGFEAASTLGEETRNPRRDIPIALIGTVLIAGVFYVVVTSAETLGFGADAHGVNALIASPSLMGDLATMYVGSWLGPVVTLGAAASAFAGGLACTVGASRLLFAMGRDGFGPRRLGEARERDGVPQAAVTLVTCVVAAAFVLLRLFAAESDTDVFFWAATVGSLGLMSAYAMCLVGAIRFLFFGATPRVSRREIVVPLAGLAAIGFIIYTNVYPRPAAPYSLFPYLIAGWILVGVVIVLSVPGLAARIGGQFATESEQADVPVPVD
ncbi:MULTISPECIES: APC family permease [unclassified Streptomyces]|uniref:APC family permease n=1 Tax=unclassified Streptomyces TaxID=2593676 RepID=UPI002238ED57|nr:APC family permease [Streptomyces sp. SHP 1-2]MCW5253591.1 APC family permease [Streptomyces sp. SHP 1-2]